MPYGFGVKAVASNGNVMLSIVCLANIAKCCACMHMKIITVIIIIDKHVKQIIRNYILPPSATHIHETCHKHLNTALMSSELHRISALYADVLYTRLILAVCCH